MDELIFMKPYLREAIWGGTKLHTRFGYPLPSEKTGEAWIVSAVGEAQLSPTDTRDGFLYPGESVVAGGSFDGQPLSLLWKERRDLFGGASTGDFPLLIKLIDAQDDLSVQTHPDDAYARAHENRPFGKHECWYILDCDEDAEIIVGHTAQTKDELREMVANGDWKRLLKTQRIKKGDFFDIPAGTVHAIQRGALLLEIQQTSNLTYRLYDYDRLENGKKRPLHIEKALDVITCPQAAGVVKPVVETLSFGAKYQKLCDNHLFRVEWFQTDGAAVSLPIARDRLQAVCVAEGEGNATTIENQVKIKAGDAFLIAARCSSLSVSGNLSLILASCS